MVMRIKNGKGFEIEYWPLMPLCLFDFNEKNIFETFKNLQLTINLTGRIPKIKNEDSF